MANEANEILTPAGMAERRAITQVLVDKFETLRLQYLDIATYVAENIAPVHPVLALLTLSALLESRDAVAPVASGAIKALEMTDDSLIDLVKSELVKSEHVTIN